MSREELKDMLKPTVAFDTLGEMGSVRGLDELVDAMVAAYNRAVDDCLEVWYNPPDDDSIPFEKELKDLKI